MTATTTTTTTTSNHQLKKMSIISGGKQTRRKVGSTKKTKHVLNGGSSAGSVRFSEHVHVKEIPHRNDLTQEEIHNVWLNRQDFRIIQWNCLQMVASILDQRQQDRSKNNEAVHRRQAASSSSTPPLKQSSQNPFIFENIRGLEQLMPQHVQRKKIKRRLLYHTIQQMQKFSNDDLQSNVVVPSPTTSAETDSSSSLSEINNNENKVYSISKLHEQHQHLIANFCQKFSSHSVAVGLQRGQMDAQVAKEINIIISSNNVYNNNAHSHDNDDFTTNKRARISALLTPIITQQLIHRVTNKNIDSNNNNNNSMAVVPPTPCHAPRERKQLMQALGIA